MSIDIARVWKDADYRASLTAEELANVPANPAGEVELSDEDLLNVVGGGGGGGGGGTVCQVLTVCVGDSVVCNSVAIC